MPLASRHSERYGKLQLPRAYPSPGTRATPIKVLIAEDNPDIVELVSVCVGIRWPDAEIVSAAEGLKGLDLAQTEHPDLALLDLGLPDVSGLEVLRDLREVSQVPIAMLTAQDRDVDIAVALREGADDYIVKPFSQIEFIARLEALMHRTRGTEPTTRPGLQPSGAKPGVSNRDLYDGTVNLYVHDAADKQLGFDLLQQLRYLSEVRVLRVSNRTEWGVDIRLLLRQPTPLLHMLTNLEAVTSVELSADEDDNGGDEGSGLNVTLRSAKAPSPPSQTWSPCVFCKVLVDPGAKKCLHCGRIQR